MAGILPTIIDVSYYQGNIIWATVAKNVHFAILRVQDGTFADPKLATYIKGCESNNIPYYVYGFYRNGGAVEAARMVSRTKAAGAKKVRGYILDVEVSGQSISSIKSAMSTLNATGLDNGIYIANHLYSQYGGTDYGEKFRWIPTYGANDGKAHTPPSHYCDLWQFTSQGTVPGVPTKVDCNAINGNRTLASFTGPITVKPNTGDTADLSLSANILLGNTMSGMYGNGEDRKKNLGSRYDEIQALVNHVCTASTSTLASEVKAGKYGNGDERVRALGPRYEEVQAAVNKAMGASTTSTAKKVTDSIVNAVIRGDYGNGSQRVTKLRKAGYDPDAVQDAVNAKLGVKKSTSSSKGKIVVGSTVKVTNPYDENGTHLAVSGTYKVTQVNGDRIVISKNGVVIAACPRSNLALA